MSDIDQARVERVIEDLQRDEDYVSVVADAPSKGRKAAEIYKDLETSVRRRLCWMQDRLVEGLLDVPVGEGVSIARRYEGKVWEMVILDGYPKRTRPTIDGVNHLAYEVRVRIVS